MKLLITKTLLLAAMLLGSTQLTFAQEPTLIAFGRVDETGGITRYATTVDATISGMGFTNGRCVVEVERENAFIGYTVDEIVVHTTLTSPFYKKTNVITSINDLTDHKISVDVRMSNIEDSAAPDAHEPEDCPFYFAIHRIPGGASTIPDTSPYLFATGRYGSFGAISSGVTVPDCEVSSNWVSDGYVELTFTKPGAFADDDGSDYVVIATPYSTGSQDKMVRVYTSDFATDDSVTIRFRSYDAQDESDDDNIDPINETVYYTIYRVPTTHANSYYTSNQLTAMGRIDGSDGSIFGATTSLPGGIISANRVGTGNYEIFIESPGAFAGLNLNDFTLQLGIDHHANIDELVSGRAVVVDDNTLRIDAHVDDVEQPGTDLGTPTDRNVTFFLHSTQVDLKSDMMIGKKLNAAKMKGNNRYNTNAAGQKIRTRVKSNRAKYFFAVQNDGNLHDTLTVRKAGKIRGIKPRIIRLTGGKANVTAKIKSSGFQMADLGAGKSVHFKVKVKMRDDKRASKLRLMTTSSRGGSADACLAKVKAEK